MDKVKKFVILPISLLLLELLLQFNNTNMNLCLYLFQDLQFNFGRFMPRILLSFLVVLLFVCSFTVLFLWVFTNTSPKILLNPSAAKAAILAFAINYLIILLVEPKLYSLLSNLFYRDDTAPWLFIFSVSLIMTLKSFFVIAMILWLILKPLRGKFKFRTKTFFIAALGCVLLNMLFNYANFQITNALLANLKPNAAESGTMNYYLNLLVYTDKYKNLLKIANTIVYVIQDIIVLAFINSCIKHKGKVEIQNV